MKERTFTIVILIVLFVLGNTPDLAVEARGPLTIKKYNTPTLVWSIFCADIDGDKTDEIILGGLDDKICVMDVEGKVLWRYNVKGLPLSIAASDINGDGKNDIVAAVQDREGNLVVLDYNKKAVLWKSHGEQPFLCVTAGDIDNDGKSEVVAGSFEGMVYVFDHKGQLRWRKQVTTTSSIGAIAIGDINPRIGKEIVIGTRKDGVYAINNRGDIIWRLSPKKNLSRGEGGAYRRSWVRSVMIEDIDLDGTPEIIIGSRPKGMITVLDNKGKVRWNRNFPELVNDWTTAQLGVANVRGDEKKEIICLLQGIIKKGRKGTSPVIVLDANGNTVISTFPKKQIFSLTAGNIDGDKYAEVLLSSATRESCLYRLDLDKVIPGVHPWQSRAELGHSSVLPLALAGKHPQPESGKHAGEREAKIHILVHSNDRTQAKRDLLTFLRGLTTDKLVFELMLDGIYEQDTNPFDEYLMPIRAEKRGRKTQQEIIALVKQYEEWGFPFYVLVGKRCMLHMRLETMEKILRVAPNFCQGFIVNENSYTLVRKHKRFIDAMVKMMDMLYQHGEKKFILDNYLDYWVKGVLASEVFSKLFNPKYKNVLVPMYKTNRLQVPELNLGMLVGLWKAGRFAEWGFCAQDDLWKWESIFMNPPHDVILRMEVMAASLGASYFRIEANREFIEYQNKKWVVSVGAKRHRDLFHTLVRKKIIRPLADSRQLLISPLMFQVAYDASQMPGTDETHYGYWQRVYKNEGMLAFGFPLQVVKNDYLPAWWYGFNHYYDGLFPETRYGFVGLVPSFINPLSIEGIKNYLVIKGKDIYRADGRRLLPAERKTIITTNLEKYAPALPFRAKGVFMTINKFPESYLLYLLNPGHFETKKIKTVLEINLENNFQVVDVVSDKLIVRGQKSIPLEIASGTFRVLKVIEE